MADPHTHAGTIDDPIPQRLLYKNAADGKVYTVATSNTGSGNVDIKDANETTKGIVMLSDSITSTSDAALGVTAATPLAVKYVNDKLTKLEESLKPEDGGVVDPEIPTTPDGNIKISTATDTTKGISKLSDAVDSDSNAATGGAAATPRAVKDAMSVAKLALAQAGGVLDPDQPPNIVLPGTIIEPATDTKFGTTKLSDATNSSSDAATGKTAASPKAVMKAMDKAEEALALAQAGGGGQVVEMQDATDAQKGRTSLSDATDSDLDAATGITAATPKAVKAVMVVAQEALTLAGGGDGATPIAGERVAHATNVKLGTVMLTDDTASNLDAATGKTAASPKAVMKAYDLANKAFKLAEANAGQAGGGSIAMPDDANAVRKGVVKLSDAINSALNVDGITAATPLAVKTLNDKLAELITRVESLESGGGGGGAMDAKAAFLAAHPIGSFYWSINPTSPQELFGGTWERVEEGRVLISAGDRFAVGTNGGEETHTLTEAEMPAHTHSGSTSTAGNHTHDRGSIGNDLTGTYDGAMLCRDASGGYGVPDPYTSGVFSAGSSSKKWQSIGEQGQANRTIQFRGSSGFTGTVSYNGSHSHTMSLNNTGSGLAHNIMQPWLASYIWKRTA